MPDFTGQSTGRYHIIEKLGSGGMAIVYLAYDTNLDIDVAIKFVRTERLAPEFAEKARKRFKIEAQKTAKLMHANIVPVIDYGDYEGVPYLVMRYIPGGKTLKTLMGKQMRWQEAIKVILPIAEALDFAHKNQIIHRDVKPANILITDDGTPLLTDFGIAKVIEEDETMDGLTTAGMAIGTPEYMAPEQWEGGKVDGRADIYALGVVLYELITGRPPFKADTVPATMVQVLRDPLPRPKLFVPDLPDTIEEIINHVLAKKPEERYQKVEGMMKAIKSLPLRNEIPIEHKKGRKNSLQYAIIFSCVFFIIGIIILYNVFNTNNTIDSNPKDLAVTIQSTQVTSTQVIITATSTENIITSEPTSPVDFKHGLLIFSEDFNGNENQWPTSNDENGAFYIDNGEYHIIGPANEKNSGGWLAPNHRSKQKYSDFYLETKVTFIEGSQKDDTYGILFRYSDNLGPYLLMISNEQQNYSLHTNYPLIAWTYTPRIVKNGSNVIGILCIGNKITIYINGTKIDSVKSNYSSSGGIGLSYASQAHSSVDYIYVWEISK